MTFSARELSIETGKPVFMAEFMIGTAIWRNVAADHDITHSGQVYTGIPMKSGDIVDSGEIGKNDVRLEVPANHPISLMWKVSPPAVVVACILKEIHFNEVDEQVSWMGHVSGVSWPNPQSAIIVLQSGILALESNGLRRMAQRSCPHVVYKNQCKKNMQDVTHPATLTEVNGTIIKAPEFASAGVMAGGFIRWMNSLGFVDYRFVMRHTGDTLRLMTTAQDLAPGVIVDAVEGCNHTPERCFELGNVWNYGGLPFFMRKNPFDGNPVY